MYKDFNEEQFLKDGWQGLNYFAGLVNLHREARVTWNALVSEHGLKVAETNFGGLKAALDKFID